MNKEIEAWLKGHEIEFIRFVDISGLAQEQNRGYPSAVLFGAKCSPGYLKMVKGNPDYLNELLARMDFDHDEHYILETGMYRLSDLLAGFLKGKGYGAYSLSDTNQVATSNFDGGFGKTPLPLKTLAVQAGLGWIGKNNLLVNKQYGCCQHWGGVLTDAPLKTVIFEPSVVECGTCRACLDVCPQNVLKGRTWERGVSREEMIDADKCRPCLKCMVHCPWTQKYMNS